MSQIERPIEADNSYYMAWAKVRGAKHKLDGIDWSAIIGEPDPG